MLDHGLRLGTQIKFFKIIRKFGSGFTDEIMVSFYSRLSPVAIDSDSGSFEWLKQSGQERPDVYVIPEKSIIVEIKATELVESSMYGAPITWRFPRMVSERKDKPLHDIMTLTGILNYI